MISIITAVSNNGVIGVDNKLPWKAPEDMAWFQAITYGKTVIMGSKTYDSLPKSGLPGRRIIVATRNVDRLSTTHVDESQVSYETFTDKLWSLIKASPREYVVVGGAELYSQALPYASKFYVSKIDIHVDYTPEHVLHKRVTHCPFPLPWST